MWFPALNINTGAFQETSSTGTFRDIPTGTFRSIIPTVKYLQEYYPSQVPSGAHPHTGTFRSIIPTELLLLDNKGEYEVEADFGYVKADTTQGSTITSQGRRG
ncbi:hypothetical protein Hamer_G024930 [Homarus americanus]|uniref:Uncharacterized protein n=1 Tax=Homarus americanus TaxID=6706 RepID=A0A8J5NDD6_HOMAM|nr:hypothetical protein Hamer_G024930 [Homarus americanus]